MSLITWNPDVSNSTLSNNNLTASINGSGNAISTKSKSVGKWYWEIQYVSGTSLSINVRDNDGVVYRYNADGKKQYRSNSLLAYGETFNVGDVIGVVLDMDNKTLRFYKNGISQGVAFNNIEDVEYYVGVSSMVTGLSRVATANLGATPFQYPVPEGYLPYDYENAEWFSNVKSLIKSGNEIHTILEQKMCFLNNANPTQEDFNQFGMNILGNYADKINNIAYQMVEDGEVGDGRVIRRKINKNDFKINRLEVK